MRATRRAFSSESEASMISSTSLDFRGIFCNRLVHGAGAKDRVVLQADSLIRYLKSFIFQNRAHTYADEELDGRKFHVRPKLLKQLRADRAHGWRAPFG